jgi:3-hydroxybutyryl-CoA dehydrogenase
MTITNITVIGTGTMGSGIARAAATSGFAVRLVDRSEAKAAAGLEGIKAGLEKQVAKGKLVDGEKDAILARIGTCCSLQECGETDLVIEAVAEKEEIKKEIFQALDAVCPEHTIFASNTSSISITRLAGATARPDRFIGMHFMNPAHIMKLMEVITGLLTTEQTVAAVRAVAQQMDKIPVVVTDSPGFIANRVLMPMINDAIACLQEGVASREDIDTIMKLGTHHPMGPLELADFIGLDVCLEILKVLHAELGEKYRPVTLLRNMVAAGKLGRKNGAGFYDYD